MIGLTPRQRELMVYIQTREVPPSYVEMMSAIGVHSKARIFDLLGALEERGHIRRQPRRERGIEVLKPITPRLKVILTPSDCERLFERNRIQEAA